MPFPTKRIFTSVTLPKLHDIVVQLAVAGTPVWKVTYYLNARVIEHFLSLGECQSSFFL